MTGRALSLCCRVPAGAAVTPGHGPDLHIYRESVAYGEFGWSALDAWLASSVVTALDSYLLCATPRSGSTLLCGLLDSSGVAGRPASYFNRRSLDDYADEWRIPRLQDGRIDEVFVQAARAAGRTSNGVFGGRIMAENMPDLIGGLAAAASVPAATELELLSAQFGRLSFVHLRRRDVVAQAVSYAKSLQTHFWHPGEAIEPGAQEPHYDEELIGRLVSTIEKDEAYWTSWFAAQRITPCEVTYEELAADPLRTASRVLDHLGLRPDRQLVVAHHKQADHLNTAWITRFRSRRTASAADQWTARSPSFRTESSDTDMAATHSSAAANSSVRPCTTWTPGLRA